MTRVPAERGERGERGSASVVTAAVMCVLLVLTLLSADLARVLAAVSRAQTAADASALAAASSLALPGGLEPSAAAATYASSNGALLDNCDCAPGTHTAEVSVRVEVRGSVLASAVGWVHARARAEVGSASLPSPSPTLPPSP